MPAKNLYRIHEEKIYSHIYNKGVEKRIIFNDKEDYEAFLGYLKDYLTFPRDSESVKKDFTVNGRVFRGVPHQPKNYFNKVELVAYSLRPDHFHLLLYQNTKNSIQGFIRSLCTRYSIYFNKKYHRTGALFEGPYKSVHIKDEVLLPLTRYLHQAQGYSSYQEYLNLRETPWVKPKKGIDNYKDFVEKYKPSQKENELLGDVIFESIDEHGQLENLANSSSPSETPTYVTPTHRVPEVLITVVVFFALLGLGIKNIMASENKKSPVINPTSTPFTVLSATVTPGPIALPKPIVMVTVKITDGATKVNIRQKPQIQSEKIGEAQNGDIFELITLDPDWYEVRMPNNSTGFISAIYIEKRGGTNK